MRDSHADLNFISPPKHLVPQVGAGLLTSVRLSSCGLVNFHYSTSDPWPAFLLPNDFVVANALFFSEAQPIWPNFDLYSVGIDPTTGRDICHKRFTPYWISVTDFGRTMFSCQYILETLIFSPEAFSIAPKEQCAYPEAWQPAYEILDILKELKRVFHISPQSHKVFHSAFHFQREILRDFSSNEEDVQLVVDVKRFTTSIALYEANDHSVFSRSAAARRVLAYDPILEELAVALPILLPCFRRFQQLLSLLYGLNEIIKHGLQPNSETTQIARENVHLIKSEFHRSTTTQDDYCYRELFC
jgi:hypothetical protein